MLSDTYKEPRTVNLAIRAYSKVWDMVMRKRDVTICSEDLRRYRERLKWAIKLQEGLETEHPSLKEWNTITLRIGRLFCEKNPRDFLKWPDVVDTMAVDNAVFLFQELKELKKCRNEAFLSLLDRPVIGNPRPFPQNPRYHGNNIHHAYTLLKAFEDFNISIWETDAIFEFGGGYGNMCRLLHSLGFGGTYVIFDLPVMSILQSFFLETSGIVTWSAGECSKVKLISNYDEFSARVDRQFSQYSKKHTSFIATWSLSEVPLHLRTFFDRHVGEFDNILMGYQNKFGEVDNRQYFKAVCGKAVNTAWYDVPAIGLPEHNFLFGKKE